MGNFLLQEREELKVGLVGWGSGVYLPPPAAVPPISATPQQPPPGVGSSASSHSSESSTSSHHAWSFEEQFKQVTKTTTPLNGNDLALFSHVGYGHFLSIQIQKSCFFTYFFCFIYLFLKGCHYKRPVKDLDVRAEYKDVHEVGIPIQNVYLAEKISGLKYVCQEVIFWLMNKKRSLEADVTVSFKIIEHLHPRRRLCFKALFI